MMKRLMSELRKDRLALWGWRLLSGVVMVALLGVLVLGWFVIVEKGFGASSYHNQSMKDRPTVRTGSVSIWVPGISSYLELGSKTGVGDDKDAYYYYPAGNQWYALADMSVAQEFGIAYLTEAGDVIWINSVQTQRVYHWDKETGAINYIEKNIPAAADFVFESYDDNLLHAVRISSGNLSESTRAGGEPFSGGADWSAFTGTLLAGRDGGAYHRPIRIGSVVYFMTTGTSGVTGFKYDESTDTYSALTETSRPSGSYWWAVTDHDSDGYIWALHGSTFATAKPYFYTPGTGTWTLYRSDLSLDSSWRPVGTLGNYGAFAQGEWLYLLGSRHPGVGSGDKAVVRIPVWGSVVRNVQAQAQPAKTTGTAGVITSVTWEGPRLLFSDEKASVKVLGTVNTPITLQLVGEDGTVLSTGGDYIRTGGVFYWLADLPNGYSGFFYAVDVPSGVRSDWGYVAPAPAASQVLNSVSTVETSGNAQLPWGKYVVDADDVMITFWRTDLVDADMDDYRFRYQFRGDYAETTYSQTLDWLNTNYYQTGYANNKALAGWRYMLSVMDAPAGFDNKDGLVLDLNVTYSASTAGLYVPVITGALDDVPVAEPVSAYWYGTYPKDSGFAVKLDKASYSPAGEMTLTIAVNMETRMLDVFTDVDVTLVDSNGTVVSTIATFDLESGNTIKKFATPVVGGSYVARVVLSGVDLDYTEVREVPFKVVAASASGGVSGNPPVKDLSKDMVTGLENVGFGSDGGKWLLFIAGLIGCAVMALKGHKTIAIVGVLALLGLFIVNEWFPTWLVLLLGLSVGAWLINKIPKPGGGS